MLIVCPNWSNVSRAFHGSLGAKTRSHITWHGNLPRIGHRTLLGIAAAICWLEDELTPPARRQLYGDMRRQLDELEAEDRVEAA
jgi:hypothetical protein